MSKQNQIITPVGRSEWMRVFSADYKFDEAGLFGGKLHFDNTEAQDLMKQLDGLAKQSVAKAMEETGKPASKIQSRPAYEICDETGDVTIKVKLKENGNGKNGPFTQRPKVFDSRRTPIVEEVPLWNGSRMRVSFTPVLYYTAMAGAGVSLRLNSAQIIEAISGGDGADASVFDAIEDGFTVEPAPVVVADDTSSEEFDDIPF